MAASIPGAGIAVDVVGAMTMKGPHTPEEIAAIYAELRARFPASGEIAATDEITTSPAAGGYGTKRPAGGDERLRHVDLRLC